MSEFRDQAPSDEEITDYDRQCFKLYLILIDAEDSGAEWQEVYEDAFGTEIGENREEARAQYEAHLKRARWMTKIGFRQLL
ncbi:MAG: DUF2285 domain-containing protein [Hyphomicrobiaceae bacterium]|nr:DUF2285 domain-containing protein [Hyphomicrobiaceae bacterium]